MDFYITRYKNIEKQTYEVVVITPMFLAGGNKNIPELRAPSFKGMLRFWWRASCGINKIKELKDREEIIFGSSDKKSQVKLKIETQNSKFSDKLFKGKKYSVNTSRGEFNLDILHYLAFGIVVYKKGKGNVLIRKYIPPFSKFNFEIYCNNKFMEEVITAFRCMIFFGGIGSKNRNGFGCLYVKNLNGIDFNSLKNNISDYPSFTAFSQKSKLITYNEHDTWEEALSEIGLIYRNARLNLENRHIFEKRGFIAKPIEAKFENVPQNIREGRHPKPYFLHVNRINKTHYQGQILFLPYIYYNDEKKFDKYIQITKEMNNEIEKLSRGKKWN